MVKVMTRLLAATKNATSSATGVAVAAYGRSKPRTGTPALSELGRQQDVAVKGRLGRGDRLARRQVRGRIDRGQVEVLLAKLRHGEGHDAVVGGHEKRDIVGDRGGGGGVRQVEAQDRHPRLVRARATAGRCGERPAWARRPPCPSAGTRPDRPRAG